MYVDGHIASTAVATTIPTVLPHNSSSEIYYLPPGPRSFSFQKSLLLQ